jgi:hypothetical protein
MFGFRRTQVEDVSFVELYVKYIPVEEQDDAVGLILGRSRKAPFVDQIGDE